jgi:nucleotide sugar dehydrogenase
MTTCVVGLGKIGLPLAVQIASKGEHVIGADINTSVVEQVNQAQVPFPGEDNLPDLLVSVTEKGVLEASSNTEEAVRKSDFVIVVVPVIVDDAANPDFSAIDSATHDISRGLTSGTLVCYETTLPIGTTRTRFAPILEQASGLTCGTDMFIAYSPERVFSGRVFADLRAYPKLVGGLDPASTDRAVAFYERILDFDERSDLSRPNGVWNLEKAEAAEMAKLAETTYRNVNIALANEFALHAQDLALDAYSIIEASNSQPFSHIHLPGVAVGGHCIPVYPKFYMHTDSECTLPKAAVNLNESMPAKVIQFTAEEYGSLKNAQIAVMGLTYRGDVKETAFSGAFPLIEEIRDRGGIVTIHDPLFTEKEIRSLGLEPHKLGDFCDIAIIQADHALYSTLTTEDFPETKLIIDGRNVIDQSMVEPIPVKVLGRG